MANFKAHSTLGAGCAVAYAGAFWLAGALSVSEAVFASALCAFASLLPDLDCDTGRPRRFMFDTLALVIPATLVLAWLGMLRMEERFLILLAAFFLIRWPVAALFARFTTHRGIFHSVPAALICAGLAFLLFTGRPSAVRWCYTGACLLGYASHLVLDEMCAVGFLGLFHKKSLGTALQLRVKSRLVTAAAWFLALALAVLSAVV